MLKRVANDIHFSKEEVINLIKGLWGQGEGYRFYLKTFSGLNDPGKLEFRLDEVEDFCSRNHSIIRTLLRIQVRKNYAQYLIVLGDIC